jgi:hypothetical protein
MCYAIRAWCPVLQIIKIAGIYHITEIMGSYGQSRFLYAVPCIAQDDDDEADAKKTSPAPAKKSRKSTKVSASSTPGTASKKATGDAEHEVRGWHSYMKDDRM